MTITHGHNLKCFCDSQTDDDCHQDLLHELSRRLDTVRRCQQYIINANSNVAVIDFWRNIRQQEADNIHRIQALLLALENQQAARTELYMLSDFDERLPVPSLNFSHVAARRIPVAT